MILLDFSATIFASLHVDIKGGQKPQYDYIRHLVINTIRAYNAKFRHQFGELFIITDNKSWRQSAFPLYKYSRQWERNKNPDQDWEAIWDMFSKISSEIKEHLPFPFLGVKFAEADDIIGVISKSANEETVIVSNDKDFGALCKFANITQYRPSTSSFFEPEDVYRFEYELIMKGDKSDGIPNIRCPDDFYMAQCIQKDGGWKVERASPVSKKFLSEYWDVYQKGSDIEKEEAFGDMYDNFKRNRRLISLDYIPDILIKSINLEIDAIQRNNPMKLLQYFQKNQMHLMAKHLSDFTPNKKRTNELF